MMDECTDRLITAMRLLEMQIDPATRAEEHTYSVMSTVHELIQRAWFLHAGHEGAPPISENTLVLLSTLEMIDAINDARADAFPPPAETGEGAPRG